MSRYARMNPENPQGVPSAFREMEADAMRKGELPRPDGLCAKHTEEHRRAQENGREWCRSAHNDPNHEVTACDSIQCPVCFNEANEKAYDREARLAEHAEEMVELLETIREWHAEAMIAADNEGGGSAAISIGRDFPRGDLDALLSKIEGTPAEGNKP